MILVPIHSDSTNDARLASRCSVVARNAVVSVHSRAGYAWVFLPLPRWLSNAMGRLLIRILALARAAATSVKAAGRKMAGC
jgi:hypothetical protein